MYLLNTAIVIIKSILALMYVKKQVSEKRILIVLR